MEEIKRRKTPKKPGPGCLTGGWRYPKNESIFTYKYCDNIQPYPLDSDFSGGERLASIFYTGPR